MKFDETKLVGDAVFTELVAAVTAADSGQFDAALLRLTSLVAALSTSVVIDSFKSRQDRRHWFAVLVTCTCEVVKYWARRVLARTDGTPLLATVPALCHAYDAVARLSEFLQRACILDVSRSALGTLGAAVVVADESVIVENDVIDAADTLLRQSAAIVTQGHLLAAVASLLPSANEAGRAEAHGMQARLTSDGVMDAAPDTPASVVVIGELPPQLRALPSGANKRDRSLDGVTGVRVVSTRTAAGAAPAHASVPQRDWTPLVLSSVPLAAADALLLETNEAATSSTSMAATASSSSAATASTSTSAALYALVPPATVLTAHYTVELPAPAPPLPPPLPAPSAAQPALQVPPAPAVRPDASLPPLSVAVPAPTTAAAPLMYDGDAVPLAGVGVDPFDIQLHVAQRRQSSNDGVVLSDWNTLPPIALLPGFDADPDAMRTFADSDMSAWLKNSPD